MNGVDVAVAVLVVVCAIRGYSRGFIRECFGLLALVFGVAAAAQFTDVGTALFDMNLPTPVATGVVFVGIFVLVDTLLNIAGALFNRLAGGTLARSVNRLAGAAFGAGKAALVLGFILLFLHLFPFIPMLDQHIMRSTIGRPLAAGASTVVRFGVQNAAAQPGSPSRT